MRSGYISPHVPSGGLYVAVTWSIQSQDADTNTSAVKFTATGRILNSGGLPASWFNSSGIYRQTIRVRIDGLGLDYIDFVLRVEQANPSTVIWEVGEVSRDIQHEENGLKTMRLWVFASDTLAGGAGVDVSTLDGRGDFELDPINPTGTYRMKGTETTNPAALGGLIFSWTGTQSEANNRSTISWKLQAAGGATTDSCVAGPLTVTINGAEVLTITSRFRLYGGGSWYKTGTATINHDASGNAKMSTSISAAAVDTQVNTSVTAEFTLDKINATPGAPTTCTITAGHGGYVGLGDPITIAWSGATGTITGYDVQYRRGNSGWITLRSISTSAASGSITDTFNDTDINATGAGKTIQYRVRAKNGSLVSGWRESNSLTMSGAMDINSAGTWKTGTLWINVGGTWKRAKRVWIKDGSTWKESR